MSRGAVIREIALLDELSRKRALTDSESRRLQLLITTDRRYDSGKSAASKLSPKRRAAEIIVLHRPVRERLLSVANHARSKGVAPRAAYLNQRDFAALITELGLPGEVRELTVDQLVVRCSKSRREVVRSVLYDEFGCAWTLRR